MEQWVTHFTQALQQPAVLQPLAQSIAPVFGHDLG